jgi:hypothetical protein
MVLHDATVLFLDDDELLRAVRPGDRDLGWVDPQLTGVSRNARRSDQEDLREAETHDPVLGWRVRMFG